MRETALLSLLLLVSSCAISITNREMLVMSSVTSCDIPRNRQALNDLYFASGGPSSWSRRTNWNTTTHLSLWFGVACGSTSSSNSVVGLSLASNGLSGSLSDSLQYLDGLQTLHLELNHLTGTLPSSWSAWGSSITAVALFGNALTGRLPASWAAFSRLQVLQLAGNKLSGSLQPSWSQMTSINTFSIEQNNLTGTLPMDYGSQWKNVTSVFLQQNALSGSIPEAWGSGMATLQVLFLHQNNIAGSLPDSIASLRGLQWLQINDNQLTGPLRWSWGTTLSSLRALYLQNNNLEGTLPASWMGMASLQILDLSNNALSGRLPMEWPLGMVSILSMSLCSRRSTKLWCGGPRPVTWTHSSRPVVFNGSLCTANSSVDGLPHVLDGEVCTVSQSEDASRTPESKSADQSVSIETISVEVTRTSSKPTALRTLSEELQMTRTRSTVSVNRGHGNLFSATITSSLSNARRSASPTISVTGDPQTSSASSTVHGVSQSMRITKSDTSSRRATRLLFSATATNSPTKIQPTSGSWDDHCVIFHSPNCAVGQIVILIIIILLVAAAGSRALMLELRRRRGANTATANKESIRHDNREADDRVDNEMHVRSAYAGSGVMEGSSQPQGRWLPRAEDELDLQDEGIIGTAALRPVDVSPNRFGSLFARQHEQQRPLVAERYISSGNITSRRTGPSPAADGSWLPFPAEGNAPRIWAVSPVPCLDNASSILSMVDHGEDAV